LSIITFSSAGGKAVVARYKRVFSQDLLAYSGKFRSTKNENLDFTPKIRVKASWSLALNGRAIFRISSSARIFQDIERGQPLRRLAVGRILALVLTLAALT